MRSNRQGPLAMGLLCVLAICGLIGINGEPAEADTTPPGNMKSTWVLPEHPSKEFPAGDFIPILVTLHNAASNNYNMSYIKGSLNLPNEFSFYVQNFSYVPYYTNIPSKHEVTFQYKFRPDKTLRPMELQVALTMFYQDDTGTPLSTTFFNETADIVDKPKVVDYEAIMMVVVMIAILGAAVYAVMAWFGTLNVVKKASVRKSKGSKPAGEGSNDDWLEGTPQAQKWADKKNKAVKQDEKSKS